VTHTGVFRTCIMTTAVRATMHPRIRARQLHRVLRLPATHHCDLHSQYCRCCPVRVLRNITPPLCPPARRHPGTTRSRESPPATIRKILTCFSLLSHALLHPIHGRAGRTRSEPLGPDLRRPSATWLRRGWTDVSALCLWKPSARTRKERSLTSDLSSWTPFLTAETPRRSCCLRLCR
jgi:hypothetical protein